MVMRAWFVGASLLTFGAIGCADSVKLENEARVHTLRADEAARARNYDVASREQSEAERLHAKAVNKAYREAQPPPPNNSALP
jgi:hypothetical protein